MSKGFLTKHITTDGSPFYYNAEQAKSVWTPPQDSIVLEAQQPQTSIPHQEVPLNVRQESSSMAITPNSGNDVSVNNSANAESSIENMLIDAAASAGRLKQKSNRFAKNSSKNSGAEASEYTKLVNSYQSMSGKEKEEGGKWLVR